VLHDGHAGALEIEELGARSFERGERQRGGTGVEIHRAGHGRAQSSQCARVRRVGSSRARDAIAVGKTPVEATLPEPMAFDIPPGTTARSLVETVFPAIHAQHVPDDAPTDAFTVVVRIDDVGSWTVHIRGREMRAVAGEAARPTMWLFTTARAVERFLEDAQGPQRFLP